MLTVAEVKVTFVLSPSCPVHKHFNILELKMTVSLSGVFAPCSALFQLFYVFLHGFGPPNWIC